MIIFQVGWFIQYTPRWLGPLAIITGLFILLNGYLKLPTGENKNIIAEQMGTSNEILTQAWKGILLVVTVTLCGIYLRYTTFFIVVVSMLGHYVGGLGAARFYHKLSHLMSTKRWPFSGTIVSKIKYYPVVFVFIVVIAGLAFRVLRAPSALIFSWTIAIFVFSCLGYYFRLNPVEGEVMQKMSFGAILCFAGAEISNLILYLDVIVYILSSAAYSFGFLLSIYSLIGSG
jgi:hypothetical protein